MTKKVAVILSGCGHKDGAEIREAVLTLLYLDQNNIGFDCYAPNQPQAHVINHLTGQVAEGQTRNTLEESARIARGDIAALDELDPENYAGIVMPGGFGAAKNLSDFVTKGASASVIPSLSAKLQDFYKAGKPIAAICIAPAVVAATLKKGKVTIGNDESTANIIQSFGASHENRAVTEICVDEANKLITTPAYMFDAKISDVAKGVEKLVKKLAEML